jgi:HD-GYP domain
MEWWKEGLTAGEPSDLSRDQIILLCSRLLRLYDRRLVDHGDRVAWIAFRIWAELPAEERPDLKRLILLCIFHDVGAYRTDEIDRMMEFESRNVQPHSVYGSLVLRYLTPLGDDGNAILYHHLDHRKFAGLDFPQQLCAEIIHLADRADVAIATFRTQEDVIARLRAPRFNQELADALERAFACTPLFSEIALGTYTAPLRELVQSLNLSETEAVQYLTTLVHIIDFKSKYTAVHSLNTTVISVFLARKMGLPAGQVRKIHYAALVHDVGKMAIPLPILEYPGPLNPEDMTVMRRHVLYTEAVIQDVLSPEITGIASHHHEKLDGSGYPRGLTGERLSLSDRIVAVSDIISALNGQRSYKAAYGKKKTLAILAQMRDAGQLDPAVTDAAAECYEELMDTVAAADAPVLDQYRRIWQEYDELIGLRILQD